MLGVLENMGVIEAQKEFDFEFHADQCNFEAGRRHLANRTPLAKFTGLQEQDLATST